MVGALPFFESCGFQCPVEKDPGSFMQEVTTAIGQAEFATAALRARKGLPDKFDVALYHDGTLPGTPHPEIFIRTVILCSSSLLPAAILNAACGVVGLLLQQLPIVPALSCLPSASSDSLYDFKQIQLSPNRGFQFNTMDVQV